MTCPNCGADVPLNARACPECGSDKDTGWAESAETDHLSLPDGEDFNYDDFVQREFGGGEKVVPRGIAWYWWATAVLLLGVLLAFLIFR
jgi:hypothetical protein